MNVKAKAASEYPPLTGGETISKRTFTLPDELKATAEQREFLLYMMGVVRGLLRVAVDMNMISEGVAAEQYDKLGELAGKAGL